MQVRPSTDHKYISTRGDNDTVPTSFRETGGIGNERPRFTSVGGRPNVDELSVGSEADLASNYQQVGVSIFDQSRAGAGGPLCDRIERVRVERQIPSISTSYLLS